MYQFASLLIILLSTVFEPMKKFNMNGIRLRFLIKCIVKLFRLRQFANTQTIVYFIIILMSFMSENNTSTSNNTQPKSITNGTSNSILTPTNAYNNQTYKQQTVSNYDILKQYIPTQQLPVPRYPAPIYPMQYGFANINYIHNYIPKPPFQLANQQQQTKSEQDILDNGFMDLFQQKTKTEVNELKAPAWPAPPLPNANLIDLDVVKDRTKNILELFDPLTQSEVSKQEPLVINKTDITPDSEVKALLKEPNKMLKKRNSLNLDDTNLSRDAVSRIARKYQTVTELNQNRRPSSALGNNKSQDIPKLQRSFSFYEKANNIESFLFIEKDNFSEFNEFEYLIDELKLKNDELINLTNITVFSPLLERPILKEINIKIIIKYKQKQISLQTPISSSAEQILYNSFEQFDMSFNDSQKYLFKIHGLEEYVPMEAILCELKYIQDCLILSKDPTFLLCESFINSSTSSVSLANNVGNFKFKLQTNSYYLNKISLDIILESIRMNKQMIKDTINDFNNKSLKNLCSNFKDKLKHLQTLIFNINFTALSEIITRFEYIIEHDFKFYDTNNNNNSKIKDLYKKLLDLANDAMHACIKFINCASTSFYWSYKLEFDMLKPECLQKQQIIQADEKVVIYINTLNNLQHIIGVINTIKGSNIEVFLKCSIYYGANELDSVKTKPIKIQDMRKRNDLVFQTNTYIFENLPLCLLPREAVLVVQLCVALINNDNSYTEKCVAWASKAFLDNELVVETGDFFLCLYQGESPLTCTTASNLYSDKAPILYFTFASQDYVYVFPNITDTEESPPKEFDPHIKESTKRKLYEICNRSIMISQLEEDDKQTLREHATCLYTTRHALAKIYLSCPGWDYTSIVKFYGYLKNFESLSTSEALELLLPHFPDIELRNLAIKSLQFLNPEPLSLYLPQLLEALKYEKLHNSSLVRLLLQSATKNIRFAHKLYWHLKEFRSRSCEIMPIRYELLYQGLDYLFSDAVKREIKQENYFVDRIDDIAQKIKKSKDMNYMQSQLENILSMWPNRNENGEVGSCRLPYDISYSTNGIDVRSCSYISSFTVPLKLVFKNVDQTASAFYSIYKTGDDLRQDMFVLQLINIMNQLWLSNDHDLCVITFNCLQIGDRKGFIEMITNAQTLKEIQGAAINAFKKSIINGWLKSHNPIIPNFMKAVSNFTKSCAAYSVATYILGIGDRHNDNVMIKYTGHLFHIDFGKYMGDKQMFGFFKRDRTPILFTPDMFYVINQGNDVTHRFQDFVDLCCRAFQILRDNYNLLLTLIEMMSDSFIPGLNKDAIQFVYNNLMIDQSDDEAAKAFTKMIYDSLNNTFSAINFAIHTIAQPCASNTNNLFSFVTENYSVDTDGRIIDITLEDEPSNIISQKPDDEVFKCKIVRENEYESHHVLRTFDEFYELYQAIMKQYPSLKLHNTPILSKFKESKLVKKRLSIASLIMDLLKSQPEIRDSDIIYTFFHPILRDQNSISSNDRSNSIFDDDKNSTQPPDVRGKIKIKLKYKDMKFTITVLFARNLKPPNNQTHSSLKPYVKAYLKPDARKLTKQKVHAMYQGVNPIFNETMEYNISLCDLKNRTLEISVNDNSKLGKEKIGSVEIRLHDIPWDNGEYIKWYDLR